MQHSSSKDIDFNIICITKRCNYYLQWYVDKTSQDKAPNQVSQCRPINTVLNLNYASCRYYNWLFETDVALFSLVNFKILVK